MNKIHTRVMASVVAIYIARVLTGMRALKLYALILSVWGIGRLVWVSKVFENLYAAADRGIGSVSTYLLAAVEHTHLGVQLVLLIAACAGISLLFDLTRSITPAGNRSFAA